MSSITLNYGNRENAFMYDTGRVEYQVLDEETGQMVLTTAPSNTIVKMVWAMRSLMPGEIDNAKVAVEQLARAEARAWDKIKMAERALEAAKAQHSKTEAASVVALERLELARQAQGE